MMHDLTVEEFKAAPVSVDSLEMIKVNAQMACVVDLNKQVIGAIEKAGDHVILFVPFPVVNKVLLQIYRKQFV